MEHLNKIIGKYKLTRFIGEGGMASVYEGTHERLGTKVAVKILNPILTANKQIRQRFENEAKFMASLNHPNIIKVIDYDEKPDLLAIVMELLEGQDLSTLINTKGPLKPAEVIPIFLQILDAFQYAHGKGIVHRDVKPSNIYIDTNNQVKILDFGIAKIFGTGDDFTSTGTQMGTPTYMSPEQVKADKSIEHRSDIYSLGATLFFTLTGKPPYDNTTQSNFEIFNKIVYEPIPDLASYPEMNQVIKQAVSKDRNQRFQESIDFKNALLSGNFQQTSPIDVDKTLIEKQQDNKTLIDKPIAARKNVPLGTTLPEPNIDNNQINLKSKSKFAKLFSLVNRNKKLLWKIFAVLAFIFCVWYFQPTLLISNIYLKYSLKDRQGTFTDPRDLHIYKTIKIGDQIWLAENLAYKPNKGNYWAYENDTDNVKRYGYLYDWETACKVCPQGWHLPDKEEFETLINYLSSWNESHVVQDIIWNNNEGPLLLPNGNSGFSYLFGGIRYYNAYKEKGNFEKIGESARYWSNSAYSDEAIFFEVDNFGATIYNTHKENGYAVRCIQN